MQSPVLQPTRQRHRFWKGESFFRTIFWIYVLSFGAMPLSLAIAFFWSFVAGLLLCLIFMFTGCAAGVISLWLSSERYYALLDCKDKLQFPKPSDIQFLTHYDFLFNERVLDSAIKQATVKALRSIHAQDRSLVDTPTRKILNKALLKGNEELAQAILAAWGNIGDSDAIPYVRQLANGQTRSWKSPSLRQAAQECLTILQERASQENNPATLLRASAQVTSPDVLLRPASGVMQSMPEEAQLLRPTVRQGDAPDV